MSLVAYGLGALVAIGIFWPRAWRVNVAHDVAAGLQAAAITPTKLRWDLALGHQLAIGQSIKLVDGKFGLAVKFRLLLLATACVVIFAGTNVYQESQQAPRTDPPTRVIIETENK
ncbi:hypothetical protein [Mycolicibacterium sp. XJ870]